MYGNTGMQLLNQTHIWLSGEEMLKKSWRGWRKSFGIFCIWELEQSGSSGWTGNYVYDVTPDKHKSQQQLTRILLLSSTYIIVMTRKFI